MRRRGFTLIEMLIVLVIIALLAALLFPVFAQARESGRRTTCLAQIRQVGTAIFQYSQDYDDGLPVASITAPRSSWVYAVQPYARSWRVFYCPSMAEATFAGQSVWRSASLANFQNLSIWEAYGLNSDYLSPPPRGRAAARPFPNTGMPVTRGAAYSESETVLCTGISLAAAPGSWAGRDTLHPERGGYFLAPSPAGVTTGMAPGNAGWGVGSALGPYGGFEAPRHGGRGAVLFLDGHAKIMSPEALAAGTSWSRSVPNSRVVVTDSTRYLWDLQ